LWATDHRPQYFWKKNHARSITNVLVNTSLYNPLRSNYVQVSKNMFLFFKRINIFLLSLLFIFVPITNYAYAIDPIIPPFTSAPAAADIAASLGYGGSGGFAAGAASVAVAAAAIGVGVGSFCIASAVQGANACGVNSAICNALTGALINCTPTPNGGFNHLPQQGSTTPTNGQYRWKPIQNYVYSAGQAESDINAWSAANNYPAFHTIHCRLASPTIISCTGTYDYNGQNFVNDFTAENNPNYDPNASTPTPTPATPDEVGKAVASNAAAAAALGAAAAAAAGVGASANSSNCSGSIGTFNGVSTCVPALGPSNNPSCTGYSGVINGQVACAHAAGDPASGSCSGVSVTINGTNQCTTEVPANPACTSKLLSLNNSWICIGSDDHPSYDAQKATQDAVAAAQAVAAHPPSSRSCASNMQLQSSGICVNPALPNPNNSSCKNGYVLNGSTCVPADPLNPSIPASTTPLTPSQVAANVAALSASTTLTQARANAQATAADAAANPTDQTKAAAATAAAAALQQATLDAVAANTAATAASTAVTNPTELPAFCGWAAIVCDFANAGISAIKWAKTDADAPTDTNANVKSGTPTELQNFDMHKSYFNFGSQCPADVPMTFMIMGKTTTLNFQYTSICDFLGKIRPFVIGSAWIAGAFIITGSSRKGGDD
jgi:hypothetical protein